MARPLRIEFEGAMYHVMCRGNNGGDIFFGDKGRKMFLDTLDEACVRGGWKVHAFVLMGNHYHLLLETPGGNLVEGMKWFQGTYTQRVNAWRKRRGHLFQGRYKAQLINSEQRDDHYFQVVSDYIHLNPARARMVGAGKDFEKLSAYRWSSLPLYLGAKGKRPSWLVVDRVLESYCFKDNTVGKESYGRYMNSRGEEVQGVSDEKLGMGYEELQRGWCLGDGDFRQKMLDLAQKAMEGKKVSSVMGEAVREHGENEARRMLTEGLSKLKIQKVQLSSLPKSANEKRALAAWISQNTLVSASWIVEALCMGHASVVSRAKNWAKHTKEGREWVALLATESKIKD